MARREEDDITVISLLHPLLDVLGGLLAGMVGLAWLPDAVSERWPEEWQP